MFRRPKFRQPQQLPSRPKSRRQPRQPLCRPLQILQRPLKNKPRLLLHHLLMPNLPRVVQHHNKVQLKQLLLLDWFDKHPWKTFLQDLMQVGGENRSLGLPDKIGICYTVGQKIWKSPGQKKLVKSNKSISRKIFLSNFIFCTGKKFKSVKNAVSQKIFFDFIWFH